MIQKLLKDNVFLNAEESRRLFEEKEIYVFGTGVDGECVERELSDFANILAYVDNYRSGEKIYFYKKRIISLEECLNQRNGNQPILIATYRFAIEICKQLIDRKLLPGIDFFVWDDKYLFHYNFTIQKYIRFLKIVWKKHKKKNNTNKVVIAFDNKHDMMSVIYAYCANYFAEKFDATIYGYIRFGARYENASEIIKEIYKAFNVESLINSELNEKQKREAKEICELIWQELFTWEDWKNITVYGICFGTTIIRHLLRVYIPSFDLRDEKMHKFLKNAIETIVFWYHYITDNNVKVVLLADGVTWDGYIRDIALTKGIPTYALCYKMAKMTLNYYDLQPYLYFKDMWNQLSDEEKEYGLIWAKEHIQKRLQGNMEEVFGINKINFVFAEKEKEVRILDDNNKLKVLICPHIFEEDCFACGEQIFDNNYFAWLCHLGELSEKTPEYDWYLKMHPSAKRRDIIIIDMILEKYSKIKKIPLNISPLQLKKEGVKFALTVCGTIGHEYPEIGIQVINAGTNPHSTFNFTWNPKTKQEYSNLILHLDQLEEKIDEQGLCQFYSLNYLFYDWEYISYRTLFFDNPLLAMHELELQAIGKELGTWKYEEYMKEWTEEKHNRIWENLKDIFQKLDEWRPEILYKRQRSEQK